MATLVPTVRSHSHPNIHWIGLFIQHSNMKLKKNLVSISRLFYTLYSKISHWSECGGEGGGEFERNHPHTRGGDEEGLIWSAIGAMAGMLKNVLTLPLKLDIFRWWPEQSRPWRVHEVFFLLLQEVKRIHLHWRTGWWNVPLLLTGWGWKMHG